MGSDGSRIIFELVVLSIWTTLKLNQVIDPLDLMLYEFELRNSYIVVALVAVDKA